MKNTKNKSTRKRPVKSLLCTATLLALFYAIKGFNYLNTNVSDNAALLGVAFVGVIFFLLSVKAGLNIARNQDSTEIAHEN